MTTYLNNRIQDFLDRNPGPVSRSFANHIKELFEELNETGLGVEDLETMVFSERDFFTHEYPSLNEDNCRWFGDARDLQRDLIDVLS